MQTVRKLRRLVPTVVELGRAIAKKERRCGGVSAEVPCFPSGTDRLPPPPVPPYRPSQYTACRLRRAARREDRAGRTGRGARHPPPIIHRPMPCKTHSNMSGAQAGSATASTSQARRLRGTQTYAALSNHQLRCPCAEGPGAGTASASRPCPRPSPSACTGTAAPRHIHTDGQPTHMIRLYITHHGRRIQPPASLHTQTQQTDVIKAAASHASLRFPVVCAS